MRSYKTEGIVIKRRNFGEADRILTVFTKYKGKIQIKALGVRRITSRRAPHVELLNNSFFHLYKSPFSLPILTEVESFEDFSEIKSDLTKVGFAYHICELADGLCAENQDSQPIFYLLQNTLKRLSEEEEIIFPVHDFEIELLTLLGFWPKNRSTQNLNTALFIENILERKLKSKELLRHFS